MFTFIIGIMLGALFIYVLRGKAKAPERIERPLTADGRRLVVTEELEELVKSKKLKQMVLDDVTKAYSDYYSYEGEAFVIPKSAKVESQIKHGEWESNEYPKARDQVTEVVPNEADKGKTSNWEDWELGDSKPEVFRSSQPPPLPEKLPPPIPQPPQVRTHHAAPEVPKQPKVTKPPRPAFSQILASFMEDKHIRWGELIGGMLIVLCSAALVISFWSTIDSIPWLKFGLFNTLTAAMFGASHFMARRWNMPSTSKGLAVTATLLVPLNFLSMAAFSSHGTLELAKLLAIGVFGGLLYLSSAQIFPKGRIVLPAMVLLGALPMLFGWFASPLGVSISAFTLSVAILFGIGRLRSDGKCAVDIIPLIGIGIFAFLLATGYVAYQSGEVLGLLREVSPALFLLSPTLLVTGIWLRSIGDESLRIQGSAAQILGVLGSVVCLGLAFPSVGNLLLISLLGFGTMFAISKWIKLPEAHVPAALFLSIFFVLLSTVLLGGMKLDTNSTETVLSALFGGGYLLSYFFSAITLMFAGRAFRSVWYKFAALWLAAFHIVLMTVHWDSVIRRGYPAGFSRRRS